MVKIRKPIYIDMFSTFAIEHFVRIQTYWSCQASLFKLNTSYYSNGTVIA